MQGASELHLYFDNLQEAEWFRRLTSRLDSARLTRIGRRGSNPPAVESLLRYDRPDIILAVNGIPKLVVEKTSEVPTGHNVTQRFGRIANAAEEGVAFVYMLPFKAMKHGAQANVCYAPARLFTALARMSTLHNVPVLAVEWPSDSGHELVRDGGEDLQLSRLVEELLGSDFDWNRVPSLGVLERRMAEILAERSSLEPQTARPPPSVKLVETETVLTDLRPMADFTEDRLSSNFRSRPRTLVYTLGMTPENCRREDPYTGTQFLHDYVWCRSGPLPSDKHTNLVLNVPAVSKARWEEANPNEPARKSSVYYATADLIMLADGFIICQSKVGPGHNRAALETFGDVRSAD